ncbi:hypothetical protein AURDEDRAFT_125243 [Auricularia subglabra TFB-10046 SS5]|nr:hypothetical protein AURDEDRAFT_125243 [Auricularia subglabra TFB-10046 SS5]
MHFSAFVLSAVLGAVPAQAMTRYSNFDCGGPGTINLFTACGVQTCVPFDGFHSFQNNELPVPAYVQTYENANCASTGALPVNWTAPPQTCMMPLRSRGIRMTDGHNSTRTLRSDPVAVGL